MKRNLVSLGTLDVKGYSYKASDGVMKVTKGCLVVMKGVIENGLYVLQGSIVIGSASIVEKGADHNSLIWHKRLSHVSERKLLELEKQELLCRDKLEKLQFCESCIFGKATRLKFKKSVHTTTGILNYVHSDLWGPLRQHPTLDGGRYFLSIIDDFSRKVWVCILKTKDATFQKFKEWKTPVKVQTRRRVKKMTDND